MNTIETTLTTQAIFNDDHTKRYLLCKVWDDSLPKVTVIMLAPSEASGVALDTTTQLCLNNASRLITGISARFLMPSGRSRLAWEMRIQGWGAVSMVCSSQEICSGGSQSLASGRL